MSLIHPTAIVSPKAKLGNNITVEPYAIIHDDVEIGNDCSIGPHAVIYNGARIGNRVKIYQGVSVSNAPQDLKYKNEKTFFYIDDDTTVREFVVLHRGTTAHGESKIGKNCLLMAYVHVAHDCYVGDNVIIANTVQIAGHCEIEDNVIIGGVCGIHQFSQIGRNAIIGACTKVAADVPPYLMVSGNPGRYYGLNIVGLRRKGFSKEDIETIKNTYDIFYNSGLNHTQAVEKIKETYPSHPIVDIIFDFLKKSTRGVVRR
ncbi:MAG: acyl-ACP--UDP-N-acetylglucosamine O-acyltransferase [Bacteroidota bacterium]